jgi:hypothetical protein
VPPPPREAPSAPPPPARPDWLDEVPPQQRGQGVRGADPIVHNEPAVGNYTKVIMARPSANPPAPPQPPTPSPRPAAPAASPKPDLTALWIGLGALAVIAILVVLFFALRR